LLQSIKLYLAMKHIFLLFWCLHILYTNGQKYVLLDKTMTVPPSYTNTVTITDDYRKMFAIEKSNLPAFLSMMDKLNKMLTGNYPLGVFEFSLDRNTRFSGMKITVKKEDRMDVVLISDCITYKFKMHLCDSRLSNSINSFYIKAWADYIRSNLK
jgi:hypothetical protein